MPSKKREIDCYMTAILLKNITLIVNNHKLRLHLKFKKAKSSVTRMTINIGINRFELMPSTTSR
jgi:hypothetical protein